MPTAGTTYHCTWVLLTSKGEPERGGIHAPMRAKRQTRLKNKKDGVSFLIFFIPVSCEHGKRGFVRVDDGSRWSAPRSELGRVGRVDPFSAFVITNIEQTTGDQEANKNYEGVGV